MRNEQLKTLMNDERLCEALGEIIFEEVAYDDETFYRKGRYLIKAFLDGSVEDALIAICGWSLNTLLEKAAARVERNAESKDEDEEKNDSINESLEGVTPTTSTDTTNDYTMSKKGNMAYWDEIDGLAEDYVRALMEYSKTPVKDADDYDTILAIGKDITERTVKLLEESHGATFPYVDEDY